ncbi:DNA starvation/stationary phase protection protein [Streptomyces tremellae]|uniref:DNA starvation/stationary phase protection protein n=1 Tax=Streptomyces tremellae TaxID=1124239 RepID=A0ABP7EV80_9ACTN
MITTYSGTALAGRRREGDAPAATADPRTAAALQAVLVDLLELQAQAKQAHWNVVGATFHGLHLQLDDIATTARTQADTFAERLRALGASPDGTSDTVATTTTLPALPTGVLAATAATREITGRLHTTADTLHSALTALEGRDAVSADLVTTALEALEKHAWMLRAGVPAAGRP